MKKLIVWASAYYLASFAVYVLVTHNFWLYVGAGVIAAYWTQARWERYAPGREPQN